MVAPVPRFWRSSVGCKNKIFKIFKQYEEDKFFDGILENDRQEYKFYEFMNQ